MNREELTNKIYNLWSAYGLPEYKGTKKDLKDEIFYNLESIDGIDKELDYIRIEFDSLIKNDTFYNLFIDLWEDLNIYRTNCFYQKYNLKGDSNE